MLRVSKLADYGTVILAQMASQPERVYSAMSLAQELDLPLSTVRKLLKLLAGGGLLSSSRGQQGGYALARSPRDISLAEVIEVLEGPLGLTECSLSVGLCRLEGECRIRQRWQGVNGIIFNALQQVNLLQLSGQEARGPVDGSALTLAVQGESKPEI